MARLWGKTFSYDNVSVGDELPVLIKWFILNNETQKENFEQDDIKLFIHETISKTIPIKNQTENLDWVKLNLSQAIPINSNLSLSATISDKVPHNNELTIKINIESDDGVINETAIANVKVHTIT
tara:strand:- start:14063 stop:14437 length:375 start_codon:yes stop_codon:yes gene_type:complete